MTPKYPYGGMVIAAAIFGIAFYGFFDSTLMGIAGAIAGPAWVMVYELYSSKRAKGDKQ